MKHYDVLALGMFWLNLAPGFEFWVKCEWSSDRMVKEAVNYEVEGEV